MRVPPIKPCLLASSVLLFVFGRARAQQVEQRSLQGAEVAVYNLAGTMRVEGGSGSDVGIQITRGGAGAARLTIATGPVDDRPSLRVIYPASDVHYAPNGRSSTTRVRVNDDGTFDDSRHGGRSVEIGDRDGLDAHADLVVRVPAGKRVMVHVGVGVVTIQNVDGDLGIDVSASPVTSEHTRGKLSIDAGSGSVRVTDAQGSVNIDAGSGGVHLAQLKGDRLSVDAGSGGLSADGVDVARLKLDVGSGSTRLSNVTAEEITLDCGSGGVDLDLRTSVRRMNIDAGSGRVTLRLPPSLGAELDIETGSGGIDSDFPITVSRRSRTRLLGTIGDGQGRIRIESGSGGVRLVKGT